MATVSLSTLRTRIKQRTDNEHTGSEFVTDEELTGLINASYADLYGELVVSGLHTAESVYTITATGATSYALPADFYSLLGVFRSENGRKFRLGRHSVRHRVGTAATGNGSSYRVVGSTVELSPTPSSGTYEVLYIPQPAQLAAADDTLDGMLGWEEYVVVDVAIKVLDKGEDDSQHLRMERERILSRIQQQAAAVEATESWTVENVRAGGFGDPDRADGYRGYRGPVHGIRGSVW